MFSSKYCEFFKNTYLEEHLRITASGQMPSTLIKLTSDVLVVYCFIASLTLGNPVGTRRRSNVVLQLFVFCDVVPPYHDVTKFKNYFD